MFINIKMSIKTSSNTIPLAGVTTFNFLIFLPFLFNQDSLTIGSPKGDLAFYFKPMREYAISLFDDKNRYIHLENDFENIDIIFQLKTRVYVS